MAKLMGDNQQRLKLRNRSLILQLICTNENISRVQLTKMTHLTKMTVTNIVSELIEQGFVREVELESNDSVGRNPVGLDIAYSAPKIIGIQISRDACTAILSDFKLKNCTRKKIPLKNETEKTLLRKVDKLVDACLREDSNIFAIGISAIGQLEVQSGVILQPTNFFGLKNIPLGPHLREKFGLPVYIDNDMNASALAEKLFGAAREYSDFIYMGITNGIGAGIITNGRIFQNGGYAGEIGHLSINFNGPVCECGNHGCLELYTSIPELERQLREKTGKKLSFKQFCKQYDRPEVDQVLTDAMEKIGFALVSSTNMLNPQAILIGHDGALLPNKYIKMLEQEVNTRKVSREYFKIPVSKPYYGTLSPLFGSVCCVLTHIFDGDAISDIFADSAGYPLRRNG